MHVGGVCIGACYYPPAERMFAVRHAAICHCCDPCRFTLWLSQVRDAADVSAGGGVPRQACDGRRSGESSSRRCSSSSGRQTDGYELASALEARGFGSASRPRALSTRCSGAGASPGGEPCVLGSPRRLLLLSSSAPSKSQPARSSGATELELALQAAEVPLVTLWLATSSPLLALLPAARLEWRASPACWE